MKKFFILNIIFILILITGCGKNTETDFELRGEPLSNKTTNVSNSQNKYKIFLITMNQSNSTYWKTLDAGCQKAVNEIGEIDYKWIAPPEHIAKLQGECVDKAVSEGANAILISAISKKDINENLKRADDAGVKIIYVDSAADYEGTATLITDNFAAGKIAGETMLKALSEAGIKSGTIGITGLTASIPNLMLRDKGFREIFKDTNFEIASTIAVDNNPQKFKEDLKKHPEYIGFFATNQQTTFLIGEHAKENNTKQIIVGFDTADETLSLISDGIIYATMQQNPQLMGYEGIKIAVAALEGKITEKNIIKDTKVNVITKDKI